MRAALRRTADGAPRTSRVDLWAWNRGDGAERARFPDVAAARLMECIIGLYKTECIRTTIFHQGPYRTIGDVEYATAGWVEKTMGALGPHAPGFHRSVI